MGSFTDEYLELRKKRKKQASTEDYAESKSKGDIAPLYSSLGVAKFLNQKNEDNDVAPVRTTTTTKTTTAKDEDEEEKRTWFKSGDHFDDGYQFGDVSKTILGSVADVGENLWAGVLGMGEKVVDSLAYVAPLVSQGQFYQNGGVYQDLQTQKLFNESIEESKTELSKFIEKDLYDEEKVAKKILSYSSIGQANKNLGVDSETSSVFGEKSDALVQSAGQLGATMALSAAGVPWYLTTGVTSFGSEAENAFAQGASYEEAGMSAAISAGAEILSEKLFGAISFGGKSLDDALTKQIARGISNKTLRVLTKLGVDAVGEGTEEVVSQIFSNLGSALYKEESLGELLASEEAVDEYIESFFGGAVLGGTSSVASAVKGKATGADSVSGLTENEQKVVDQVYKEAVAEQEKNGKLTPQQKSKIYDQVLNDMEKGYISTDTIESILGGETYNSYQRAINSEESLKREFDALNQMKQGEMTGEQIDLRNELKAQMEEMKAKGERGLLQSQLRNEVMGLVQSDRLAESYNERVRKSQAFEADLTQYDAKQQETIKKAIESGILNNTNRTHEFVDMIAKITADKGVLFDFTNNAKLKESGFAVDGKSVNGFVTKDGVTLNIDSTKSMNSVVGHEITHVLEGTEFYDVLQQTVIEYAKGKGDYQGRYDALSKLYEGIEGANVDAELTADLVGDYLFTDADFVRNLSVEHRNVFEKLWDEVKYLCKVATAGSKEARELAKVQKAFEDAYRESGEAKTGTQYSLGYHAGDLGKAESYAKQSGGRSTGHFGTGTYFVGDEAKISDSLYGSRPHYTVEFDNYNLYKVYDDKVGKELHDLLGVIDDGFTQEFLDAAKANKFNASELWATASDRSKEYDDEVWDDEFETFISTDYVGANIRAFTEVASENGVEIQSYDEWLAEEYDHEDVPKPGDYKYDDNKFDYLDYLTETLETADSEKNKGYDDFRRAYFKLWLRFGTDNVNKALQEVVEYDATMRDSDWDTQKKSDSLATVFMKSLGYEGVDVRGTSLDNTTYGSVIYDLKGDDLAKKKAIGTAKYSLSDSNYLDAVKKGDTETAQQMVEQSAKAAGFSELLYHGTQQFGFTEVDVGESDDGMSFFATDSLEVARTYSTTDGPKHINDKSTVDIEELIDAYYDHANDFVSLVNRTAGDYNFLDYSDRELDNIRVDLEQGLTDYDDAAQALTDYVDVVVRNLYDYLYSHEELMPEAFYESEEVEKIYEASGVLFDTLAAIAKFDDGSAGNYQLYANTEGLFEIDAKGKRWNQIPFEQYDPNGFHPIVDTRMLARYAKSEGYKGVKINNVYDDGGRSTHYQKKPATVYIFFNPQEQVKSADPVTYDDNGNVIPLSERFNAKNKDIRYSLSEQGEYADTFYSQMGKVIDGVKQEKLGAASVVSMLRGKGVKAEEIKWSGIEQFLEGKKSVTKQELQDFVAGSQLQIEEETLDNKEIPYTEEQENQIAEYTSKHHETMDKLAAEWERIVGRGFPFDRAASINSDDVDRELTLAKSAAVNETEIGQEFLEATRAVKEVIEANDNFGFDKMSQAYRSFVWHADSFIRNYDMSEDDASVLRRYVELKRQVEEARAAAAVSEQDAHKLKSLANKAKDWSREIQDIKSQHYADQLNQMSKWGQYKLDGGENYREYLFKLPGSEYSNQAMAGHWGGERTGVLAHARVQDFNTPDGRMLFIEEIQSDWHNEGAKQGYADEESKGFTQLELGEYQTQSNGVPIAEVTDAYGNTYAYVMKHNGRYIVDLNGGNRFDTFQNEGDALDALKAQAQYDAGTPDAPFRKNYHEFVLKNLIRKAAEDGYDSIGWTTADIQSDRWSDEYAEGYRIEYDQDIPKFLSKYGKKWGAQVGKTNIESDSGTDTYLDGSGVEWKSVREWYDSTMDIYAAKDKAIWDAYIRGGTKVIQNGDELRIQLKATGEILDEYLAVKNDGVTVWTMPITDAMKQSVLYEGQPQYSLSFADEAPVRRLSDIYGSDVKLANTEEVTAVEDEAPMQEGVSDMETPISRVALYNMRDGKNGWGEVYGSAQEALNEAVRYLDGEVWEAFSTEFDEAPREAALPRGSLPIITAMIAVQEDVRQETITPMQGAQLLSDAYKRGGAKALGMLYNPNTGNLYEPYLERAKQYEMVAPVTEVDAPMQDPHDELNALLTEQAELEQQMTEAYAADDAESMQELSTRYGEVLARAKELESAISEADADRANSLSDADMPPMKAENEPEPGYFREDTKTPDLMADRDIMSVGGREYKAYSTEHPEIKPYLQEEARVMLYELSSGVKGERFFSDVDYLDEGGTVRHGVWTGQDRLASDDIAYLLDGGWSASGQRYTYDQIREGLEAIIDDTPAVDKACAKRIEMVLNDRLTNGYKDMFSGEMVAPNEEYRAFVREFSANESRRESFDALMETADDYAPISEEIVETPKVEKPVYNAVESEPFEAIRPKKVKEPRMARATAEEQAETQTARVLTEEPQTEKKKSKLWSIAKNQLIDRGAVFETLALKTHNRGLQGKFKAIGRAEGSAQWLMEHGNDNTKSLDAIRNEVESSGKVQEFTEYLYHLHNVDRMSLAERYDNTENKPVFGSSVTAEISNMTASQYEQANPEFATWAEDIYSYNRNLRQMLVDGGVVSQEVADLWDEMYPHYVPIRRLGDEGLNINVPLDTGRTGVNAPIKRAKGGSRDILPLFDTMGQRTLQTFKAVAKNRFGVELKNTLGTTVEKAVADMDEAMNVDNHEELLQKGKKGQKPTFTVFENGEKVTFEITEEMYDSLKPKSDVAMIKVDALNTANNIRRGLLTEYNPVFMLTNPIKDAQDVLINSQHPLRTYKNIPEAVYELVAKNGQYYREYMENGGEQNSYFDSETNTFTEKKSGFAKVVGFPLEKVSQANNFIERIPRMAEYIASRKMGRSIDVSMLDAARVTTDFSAGGDFTKMLNRNGFTFLNASVQGAAQQVRNFREAKWEGAKGWAKLAGKTVAAGLPALLLNHLLWDDDEEYAELSDYVKQNYYIVAKYGDGQFVRIPKGRTAAVIQSAFEQMENLITGNDDVDLETFAELAISNLAPNNPLDNNIIAPIAQAWRNETWYGEDLVPTRLQDLPAAEQYDESTDSISRWLGEKLNVSPYKLNYLLDQYSGGLGDTFLPMLTPEAESGDDTFVEELFAPLRDKFTADSVMNNQNVSDFYTTKEELALNAKMSGATDEDVLMSKYMNSVNSELSELYAEKREIQNSDLTDAEKYYAVREVQKQIDALAKNSLSTYDNVTIEDDTAIIGDRYYQRNDDGEWQKLSDDQVTKYEVTSEADGVYASDGEHHYRWYEPGEDSDQEAGWRKITDDELERQTEVTEGLGITPEEYWENKDEYCYAYDYPENYAVSKAVGGYESYKSYQSELYDIKADKDENGKSISGSRKEKVQDYIDNLDADYYTKIILWKNEYNSDDTYNYEIIEYLNGRNDISFEEEITILRKLGFEVDSEGNISW